MRDSPRPAGLPCQSLGLVSNSLTNLSTPPPHLILSVSEPEGECRSTLACSRKWRSGGPRCRSGYLCCASAYLRGTDRALNRLNTGLRKRAKWNGLQPASGQRQKQIHVDIERRLVTGGALSQGDDASRNHLSPLPESRWCPAIANKQTARKLDSITNMPVSCWNKAAAPGG